MVFKRNMHNSPAPKPGFRILNIAALALALAAVHTSTARAVTIIKVAEQNGKLFISAGQITARVDLSTGFFDLFRGGADIFLSNAYSSAAISQQPEGEPPGATAAATMQTGGTITWFMEDTGGPDGPGARVTVSLKSPEKGYELRTIFSYSENKPGIFIDSRLKNISPSAVLNVERLTPAAADAPNGGVFLGLDPSGVKLLTSYFFCRDENSGAPPAAAGGFSSCSDNAAAFYDEKSLRGLAAGFITNPAAVSTISATFDPANPAREPGSDRLGFSSFRASNSFNPPVVLSPGKYIQSGTLVLLPSWGPPSKELEIYAHLAAAASAANPPDPMAILSYSNPGMTPDAALSALDKTLALLAPAKPAVFKIDRGWESSPAFHDLMKATAAQIRKRGLTPGLTIAPFAATAAGETGDELRDPADNEPSPAGAIDLSRPDAQTQLFNMVRRASSDWGFSFIEIDMHGFTPPGEMFLDRPATAQASLAKVMELIHNAAGASATIATTGADPTDMPPGVDIAGVGFRAETAAPAAQEETYSFLNMARLFYLNGRLRLNNPGPLRTTGPGAAAAAAQAAMYGGALEIALPPGGASPEYCNAVKPFIPPYPRGAAPADLFDRGMANGFLSKTPPAVLNLRVATQWDKWNVVGIFGPATKTVVFESLSLAPAEKYYVYDFTAAKLLCACTGKFDAAPQPSGMRILGVRAASDAPQLISSNRSYTMGGVEISAYHWDAASATLSGTLDTSPAFQHTLTFAVPEPYYITEVTAPGAESSPQTFPPENGMPSILNLNIRTQNGGPVNWKIRFKKQ